MAGRGLHLCVGRCPGRAQRLSRGRRILGELAPPPAEPVAHGYWKELVSQLPFLRARKVRKQDYWASARPWPWRSADVRYQNGDFELQL